MKLYVYMMLGGSICTLLYIFFNRVLACEFPLKGRRIFLRINTALYLVPLPWFAAWVKMVLKYFLEKSGVVFLEKGRPEVVDTTSVWENLIIVDEKGKLLYITGYQKWLPVVVIALTIILTLIAGWLILYVKTCRRYKKTAVFQTGIPREALDGVSQKKGSICFRRPAEYVRAGRRKVQIGFSSVIETPLTIGLIYPVILLPETMKTDTAYFMPANGSSENGEYKNSMESIIRHELRHISGLDMVGRFFAFVAVVTEWFNPLSYYLLKEEIAVSEMLCDEAAVGDRTKKEKSEYIRCVMETVQKTDSRGIMAASLASSGSLLEERVKRIIGKNGKRYWKRGSAAAIMAACFMLSSVPSFAYQMPVKYMVTKESFGMDEGWENVDRVVFIAGEDIERSYQEFRHRELLFKSDNGRLCCIDSFEMEKESWERKSCRHDYKPGIVAQHIRTSWGGCVVATWEAEGCAGCGKVTATGARLATAGALSCLHFGE